MIYRQMSGRKREIHRRRWNELERDWNTFSTGTNQWSIYNGIYGGKPALHITWRETDEQEETKGDGIVKSSYKIL